MMGDLRALGTYVLDVAPTDFIELGERLVRRRHPEAMGALYRMMSVELGFSNRESWTAVMSFLRSPEDDLWCVLVPPGDRDYRTFRWVDGTWAARTEGQLARGV